MFGSKGRMEKNSNFSIKATAFQAFLRLLEERRGPIKGYSQESRAVLETTVRERFGENFLKHLPPPSRGDGVNNSIDNIAEMTSIAPMSASPAAQSPSLASGVVGLGANSVPTDGTAQSTTPLASTPASTPASIPTSLPSSSSVPLSTSLQATTAQMPPSRSPSVPSMSFPVHPTARGNPSMTASASASPHMPPMHQAPPAMTQGHLPPSHQLPTQAAPQAASAAQMQTMGFRSPQAQPNSVDDKTFYGSQYLQLFNIIRAANPAILRHVLRDHWEKTFLGSPYHLQFVLNTAILQANPEALQCAMEEFGGNLVRASKEQIINHLTSQELDEVSDLVLRKASNKFLDKAIATRFETIPARQLVNALARAERLGYDVQDIVEEVKHGGEHVVPTMPPMSMTAPTSQPSLQPQVQTPRPAKPQILYHSSSSGGGRQERLAQPGTILPSNPNAPSHQAPSKVTPCQVCDWLCASADALDYHIKKSACGKIIEADRVGKEICRFCGCRFGSGGGLNYHLSAKVCGVYHDAAGTILERLILELRKSWQASTNANQNATPQRTAPASTPTASTPAASPPASSSGGGPYGHMTADQRAQFELEMKRAEEFYGGLMRDAMELPEPERERQLSSLKNRYNTKQSMTRKKYGIRLRERRSRAQIDAERIRLFGTPNGPSLSGRDEPSSKRAKTSHSQGGSPASSRPGTDDQADSPCKRVPVSEMGGLSGSSATAELTDPTEYLTSSKPRQSEQPSNGHLASSRSNGHVQGSTSISNSEGSVLMNRMGTRGDPMAIDDDSESDDDSDDEGIPATLPAGKA